MLAILTLLGPPVDGLDCLRDVPVNSQDDKCLRRISSWMSECEEHTACSQSKSVPLPERVIEISPDPAVAPRIISSDGRNGSYIILSHHYSGDAHIPDTAKLLKGGLPVTLKVVAFPKAIADAIDVARRLGYRYLWARELCMTASEFSENSSCFLSIYGRAALMLAASAGPEADHGLFHDRTILYSPALGTGKDRFFRPRVLRWMSNIEQSPLAGLGWNVVERMLAPRIVHFTDRQLVWECASGCQFEAAKIIGDQGSGRRINAYDKSIFQRYMQDALQQSPGEINKGSDDGTKKSVARFKTWTDSVNALSWGRFATPSDKLLVVGKVALAMSDNTMGDYLAGIWSKHIISGLAWGRMLSLLTPTSEYVAPTWSWASIDGPVAIDNVQEDTTSDSLWLQKHKPKLVSHHMVLADASNPYGNVLQGSHIVLEAACIGIKKLADSFKVQEPAFQVRPVLDQSLMFDCGCCRPRSDEVQEADESKFNREIEHHVCMILKLDDLDVKTDDVGSCVCLILKRSDESDSFTRVGFLTFSLNCRDRMDALGWERRKLKLV
ncbi:HET domain protein [Penicillium riverlandense]|uniref:HET domain protein n=1 Tax=Penicillium riverlandense TaxID=1903569 RepID=UPI002547593F|nr:HET domain protein [Penicillium riverlandense]KAJ5818539.1 HET domain protein [Penicillium riverlandense]